MEGGSALHWGCSKGQQTTEEVCTWFHNTIRGVTKALTHSRNQLTPYGPDGDGGKACLKCFLVVVSNGKSVEVQLARGVDQNNHGYHNKGDIFDYSDYNFNLESPYFRLAKAGCDDGELDSDIGWNVKRCKTGVSKRLPSIDTHRECYEDEPTCNMNKIDYDFHEILPVYMSKIVDCDPTKDMILDMISSLPAPIPNLYKRQLSETELFA